MRIALLVLCAMVAGCVEDPPTQEVPAPATSSPLPYEIVFVNETWQRTNPTVPFPPPPFGEDAEVTTFDVDDTVVHVQLEMRRITSPNEIFATNCRLYDPGDEMEQAAFSGDVCRVDLPGKAGTWRVALFVENTEPMGEHEYHVLALGHRS